MEKQYEGQIEREGEFLTDGHKDWWAAEDTLTTDNRCVRACRAFHCSRDDVAFPDSLDRQHARGAISAEGALDADFPIDFSARDNLVPVVDDVEVGLKVSPAFRRRCSYSMLARIWKEVKAALLKGA
jgi:hypothetical protein